MTCGDFQLLAKKVFVGIVVTVIPALLLIGGLWAVSHLLGVHPGANPIPVKGQR